MKNVVQKSLQGSAVGHLHGCVAKLMALAVGAACYIAVLSPSSASAQAATQLKYLQLMVVLTGEATISVAGVDLIYLGLNVVLTAAENLKSDAATARDHAR